jgi:hypothetical protein
VVRLVIVESVFPYEKDSVISCALDDKFNNKQIASKKMPCNIVGVECFMRQIIMSQRKYSLPKNASFRPYFNLVSCIYFLETTFGSNRNC